MHFARVCFVTIQVFLLFWSVYSPRCFVTLFCHDSLEALKCDFTCRTSPVSLWLLLRQEVQDVEDKRLQWPMGWQKQGALGLITEKTVAAELADSPPSRSPSRSINTQQSCEIRLLPSASGNDYTLLLCERTLWKPCSVSHMAKPPFLCVFVRIHKAMSV